MPHSSAETYFYKRVRAWTGFYSGMQWRWRGFDPDRNGIRAKCIECDGKGGDCALNKAPTSNLDTWGDTETIATRCSFNMPFGKVEVRSDVGVTNGEFEIKGGGVTKWEVPPGYYGGVFGMHYVRHGSNYFKAKTSKNIPKLNWAPIEYQLTYR